MTFTISSDKSKLDIPVIHNYLCHNSYWAKGRSIKSVEKSIENSICLGLYENNQNLSGFARVISDKVVFAYLLDFFILDEFQGKGLGKMMVKHIIDDPDLQVRLWFLATASAHGLYKKFGFTNLDDPQRYMFKRDTNFI